MSNVRALESRLQASSKLEEGHVVGLIFDEMGHKPAEVVVWHRILCGGVLKQAYVLAVVMWTGLA